MSPTVSRLPLHYLQDHKGLSALGTDFFFVTVCDNTSLDCVVQQLVFLKISHSSFQIRFMILNSLWSPVSLQHMQVWVSKPTYWNLYFQLFLVWSGQEENINSSKGLSCWEVSLPQLCLGLVQRVLCLHCSAWEHNPAFLHQLPTWGCSQGPRAAWLMPVFHFCRAWMVQREKKVTAVRRGSKAMRAQLWVVSPRLTSDCWQNPALQQLS